MPQANLGRPCNFFRVQPRGTACFSLLQFALMATTCYIVTCSVPKSLHARCMFWWCGKFDEDSPGMTLLSMTRVWSWQGLPTYFVHRLFTAVHRLFT